MLDHQRGPPPQNFKVEKKHMLHGLYLSSVVKVYTLACVLNCFIHVQLFVTLWTVVGQAPPSMGFSRRDYRSGLPCPPPRNIPNPGIKLQSLISPALAGGFFTISTIWEVLSKCTPHTKRIVHFTHIVTPAM